VRKVFTERARELRKNQTDVEWKLWSRLRNRQLGGYKFRRQFAVGRYIVDFVCLERRIAIQLDGGQHSEQEGYDQLRTKFLTSEGFEVLEVLESNRISGNGCRVEYDPRCSEGRMSGRLLLVVSQQVLEAFLVGVRVVRMAARGD